MLTFAHRGASGTEPENTLRAIKAALEMGVDGIEIDIYEADDKLFVIHDSWLHRTTTGKGKISQQSVEYLQSLDAGLGEKIPTLDQVLSLVAGKCIINIELKGINNIDLLFYYLDNAIDNSRLMIDNILLSSFNHPLLYNIHQQRAEFPLGAVIACIPLEYAKFAQQLHVSSIHLNIDFINQDFVDDAHKRDLKVFVYTVDEYDDIHAMKTLGVDGIFSNFPLRIKN